MLCDVASEKTYHKTQDRHRLSSYHHAVQRRTDLKKIVGSNLQIDAYTHNLVSYSEGKLTVLGAAKLKVKSKTDVEHELTLHIMVTNQPGLLGLTSSQDLGLIKVVMVAKTEEKQTEPDKGEELRKLSEELKEDYCRNTRRYSLGWDVWRNLTTLQ